MTYLQREASRALEAHHALLDPDDNWGHTHAHKGVPTQTRYGMHGSRQLLCTAAAVVDGERRQGGA